MYRQDKATTEQHAKILRELVKWPENKVCADCKRNDARWASWNIGVFICIRCSGIHRSMGTHISRVKSVDLDTWNTEQMESIKKWGNHRANLYWEAHLRPGHVPPEHKMESFIRSKYESRRWARAGAPPSDPSVLENEPNTGDAIAEVNRIPSAVTHNSIRPASPSTQTSRQPQPHKLLSASTIGRSTIAEPVSSTKSMPIEAKLPTAPQPTMSDDLFTLDFHSPTPSTAAQRTTDRPKKDAKQDILSLFSTTTSPAFNPATLIPSLPVQAQSPLPDPFSQWDLVQDGSNARTQATSLVGTSGVGMWGVQSGWSASPAQAPPASQGDIWNNWSSSSQPPNTLQSNTQGVLETQSIWGSSNENRVPNLSSNVFASAPVTSTQKKDDAFGELWGDFK